MKKIELKKLKIKELKIRKILIFLFTINFSFLAFGTDRILEEIPGFTFPRTV